MGIKINTFLGETTLKLSEEHKIPFITVETVIKSYLQSLIDSAENGERIVLDGITSITVIRGNDLPQNLIRRPMAERVRMLSYKHDININTVDTIIRGYLSNLLTLALNGEAIVITGVTTLKVTRDERTGEFEIRGKVAPCLKQRLETKASGEYFVRGRVSPVLKDRLQDLYLQNV